jgi:hypothetical protein
MGIENQEAQHLMVYPNPTFGTTIFYYILTEPSQVTLQVYNVYGEQVGFLINEKQQKGNHQFSWDVAGLPSGIYFYRLTLVNNSQQLTVSSQRSITGKIIVVR